jgi:hypothetical protein
LGAFHQILHYHFITMKNTIFLFLAICLCLPAIGQTLKPSKNMGGKRAVNRIQPPPMQTKNEFVEKFEKGSINWTEQYIEAEGNSVFDTLRFKIKNQARLMAQRGAIVDAQRNLLEVVNGVLVEGQTTVKDLAVESDEIRTKVSGTLKGAVQVGKTKFEDGVATVRLRIPLYKDGLAEAVDTTKPAPEPSPAPAVADTVPQNVVLAVNGTYKPRLFPKLTDDQNKILLDMADAFDPTHGKAPKILRQSQATVDALKGKKGTALLEAAQDQLGNLVLSQKSKERVEKWKQAGLLIWGLVKKLILPF